MQKIIDCLWSVFYKPEDPVITKFKELLTKYPAHEWKYIKTYDDVYVLAHPNTDIKLCEYPWIDELRINNASNGQTIDEKLYTILVEQQQFHSDRIQNEKDSKIINEFLKMEI
jgi:hypothetical protein